MNEHTTQKLYQCSFWQRAAQTFFHDRHFCPARPELLADFSLPQSISCLLDFHFMNSWFFEITLHFHFYVRPFSRALGPSIHDSFPITFLFSGYWFSISWLYFCMVPCVAVPFPLPPHDVGCRPSRLIHEVMHQCIHAFNDLLVLVKVSLSVICCSWIFITLQRRAMFAARPHGTQRPTNPRVRRCAGRAAQKMQCSEVLGPIS